MGGSARGVAAYTRSPFAEKLPRIRSSNDGRSNETCSRITSVDGIFRSASAFRRAATVSRTSFKSGVVALNAAAIYPGVHYRDNTAYRMYAAGAGTCPRAERASARLISLPMHLRLTRDDVARVASVLAAAVRA